ncbi:hypothetical protein [uncultured Methanolobus sp.]|uniref:hypothetical protein n=1 Tax=uncultured Methanolobus sp. TaxID=218300 RepID=UPI0029C96ED8|nr:hypothetical protein [uncultured Methanolobus sp.]
MSRKLRQGVNIQINEGKNYAKAVIFPGEQFVCITEDENSQKINTYFDWTKIESLRTYSKGE